MQIGLHGMSGYTASKFALRGLGEALQMECLPYGIRVSVAFPPDTKTPGFDRENENKPELTRVLCEGGGTFEPDTVG